MIARLRTRCGCERYLDISDKYPPEKIEVLMVSDLNPMHYGTETEIIRTSTRIFRFYGMHNKYIPLYREVFE